MQLRTCKVWAYKSCLPIVYLDCQASSWSALLADVHLFAALLWERNCASLCCTVLHCASLCFAHTLASTNLRTPTLPALTCTQKQARSCTHTHIHTYTCTHTHAHTHAHPHTHPHTHTHTYTCTHTYIHAQMPSQLRQRFTSGASFGGGTATLTEAGFDLLSRLLVCVH